jgi:hypothetical protein
MHGAIMGILACRCVEEFWFWPKPLPSLGSVVVSSACSPPLFSPGETSDLVLVLDDGGISGHDPLWGIIFGVESGWTVMWYVGGDGEVASSYMESMAEMSSHSWLADAMLSHSCSRQVARLHN